MPNLFFRIRCQRNDIRDIWIRQYQCRSRRGETTGFNMKILYHNRNRITNQLNNPIVNYVDINTLLKDSDFLSIHATLNKDNFHFLTKQI